LLNLHNRNMARFGVASLLAGSALGLAATPAFAAGDGDLGVTIAGTTIAATSSGKVVDVTVANHGSTVVADSAVAFDLSDLDDSKVAFEKPDVEGCEATDTGFRCFLVDIKPGESLDLGITLTSKGGAAGEAGSITATVTHPGTDPVADNNSATADVAIGESGPDLYSYALDVPFNPETGETGTVAPGGEAKLLYSVGNFGDQAVSGVKLTITLPDQVTFVEVEEGCEYNDANNVAMCTYENLPIIPADEDTDETDENFSAIGFYNLIKVAEGAAAPSTLTDGSVAVEPLVAAEEPSVQRQAATNLPENAKGGSAKDVDATDNIDEFSVFVDDTSGGGGGGGLPVTGAQVGLISGVGLAVVAGGVALLLMARRRRVVLVAPQDETPTA
jgi:hypothetical protein